MGSLEGSAQGVSDEALKKPLFSALFHDVPQYERKIQARFLLSNEDRQEITLNWLKEQEVFGDTFIGTGCLFSLDAFSIRPKEVNHLLILDIS